LNRSAESALSFVLRILIDRADRLVFLRYYERELRAVLTGIVNGFYLFLKDGLYSEVFYGL